VATIRKHELISLFLFFNEAEIFSSPGDAWTHLLTAEIQTAEIQDEKSGTGAANEARPVVQASRYQNMSGAEPHRRVTRGAKLPTARIPVVVCRDYCRSQASTCLPWGADLKITEYYSEAADAVLSESPKSRGRDEL
jgi:hypothetical protein